jgi:hypothetical protein
VVPAEDVREYRLSHLAPAATSSLDDGSGPLSVSSYEGHVVGVTSTPADALAEDERGPNIKVDAVGGRPTVRYGWHLAPLPDKGGDYLSWLATDDLVVTVTSTSLGLDGLLDLAEDVEVDDGRVEVPGDIIGEIPALWSSPRSAIDAVFRAPSDPVERRIDLSVLPADRSIQAAYLALAPPDGFVQENTHWSCCAGPMPPRRTIDVDGSEVTAVALNADHHLVLLPGDGGAVVIVHAGHYTSVPPDVWIADLVRSLRPVAPDDLESYFPRPEEGTASDG